MYCCANIKIICYFLFFFAVFAFGDTPLTHAQVFPGALGNVSLVVTPPSPQPRTNVTISLNDYSVDVIGSTILWYINDVERTQDRNARSISVTIGEPGKKLTVRASLIKNGVEIFNATETITPSIIDLILEAETYTPLLYKGRALPSAGASVRIIAVVNNGSKEKASSYTYKWTHGTSVLFGGPVKGKQAVTVPTPHFGDEDLYVDVYNTDGTHVGEGYVLLTAADPELHFYEWSPLRGLIGKEVVSPFELLGNETTIYAEPYYLNASPYSNTSEFVWTINRERVDGDVGRQHAITLSRQGESGESYLEMKATVQSAIPQLVRRGIEVFFE